MRIRHYHGGLFSHFNPGALRTANLVKALSVAGHTVDVLTADPQNTDLNPTADLFNLPPRVQVLAGGAPPRRGLLSKIPRRFRPSAVEPDGLARPDLVILFDPNPMTFQDVTRYCKEHNIPLVLDIDEWMGPADFSLVSWLTLFPLRYEVFMRTLPRKISHAFAVSKAMQEHLASSGAETLLVPPLHEQRLEEAHSSVPNNRAGRIRVAVPGRQKSRLAKDKESLDLIISAMLRYPKLQTQLEVEVIGGTDDPSVLAQLEELGQTACIRNHGKLEWQQTLRLVGSSDWLVALRDPSMRRLKYGFPSKVTEALVLGTPVIANDYSDTRTALSDPTLGKIIEDLDAEALASALSEAAKHRRPREEVRYAAARSFTPQGISNAMDAFLKGAQS